MEIPNPPKRAEKRPIPLATERQREYATELGIDFPPDINRRDISALIDAAVQKRDDERFRRLEELGSRESNAWQEMREALLKEIDEEDCRLSAAQPRQMVDELANRDSGAILISLHIDDLDRLVSNASDVSFTVSFADVMTDTEVRSVLKVVGLTASQNEERE